MIYFTSDLHFGHKNILKYAPERITKITEWANKKGKVVTDDNILTLMDEWLIDLWNSTVTKSDVVYVLGDFSFHNAEKTAKILGKLNGFKHLIVGNHDSTSRHLNNYFRTISQIREYNYKDESGETFSFEMCHFPMLSWNRKEHGTIQLHGHCHGKMDEYNEQHDDLRVDVGIDGKLAKYKFLTPDDILVYMYNRKKKGDLKGDNKIIGFIKKFFNGQRT